MVLYIGDDRIDLESKVIPQSFQSFEIGDLKTRSANYTGRIKAMPTENNARIFGYALSINSQTIKPYTKLTGRLLTDGLETISSAVILLIGVDRFGYDLEVYSGSYDFFDIINTKNIQNLDLHLYDTGSLNNQIKSPYINTGLRLQNEDPDGTPWTDPDGLVWPIYAFPYQIVIEEIINQAGYEKTGNIFSDPKFAAMHFGALGYEGYNDGFTRPKEFEAIADGTQSVVTGAAYVKIEFNTLVSGNELGYWNGLDTYQAGDPQGGAYGGAWFTFKAFAVINVTVSGAGDVEFNMFSNLTGAFPVSSYIQSAGTYDLIFEISSETIGDISGIDGSEVYLRMRANSGTPTAAINSGSIGVEIRRTKAAAYLGAAGLLPDMLQKDLMKDFLVRFALVVTESKGVLNFKSLDEIIKDKANYVDWSSKIDKSSESVSFKLNNYSQNNIFKYGILEDTLIDERASEGNLVISNNIADDENTLYESPFNASDTIKFGNNTDGYVWCAYIPIWKRNSADEIEEDLGNPGLRLILIRDAYAYEANATDKGYFHSTTDYSLNFQTFIDEHYPVLSLALNKSKIKSVLVNLDPYDIAALDFLKLVYENGNWYLLNKVSNFINKRLTRTELFKVV